MRKKRYLVIFKAKYQSTAPSNFCSAASIKEALNTCIKLYINKVGEMKIFIVYRDTQVFNVSLTKTNNSEGN